MIRLYIPKIYDITTIENEQFHYLTNVMRVKINDNISIFNPQDGEFLCKIIEIKKKIILKSIQKTSEFIQNKKKIFCIFSKIKQKNVELIIQKCTEIGINGFIPMSTSRTTEKNLNIERFKKIAIESSEQCGRIDIPEFLPEISIQEIPKLTGTKILLSQFTSNQTLQDNTNNENIYIISGPEGGFSENEITFLNQHCNLLNLSKNILRAETATILGCGIILLNYKI